MDKKTAKKIIAKKNFTAVIHYGENQRLDIKARWRKHGYLVYTRQTWELFWCSASKRWYEADFGGKPDYDWFAPKILRRSGRRVITVLHHNSFELLITKGYAALVREKMKLDG